MSISLLEAASYIIFGQFLSSGMGVQISCQHFTSYVTLDELFNDSVPQFPYLYHRGNNDINLIILFMRLRGII